MPSLKDIRNRVRSVKNTQKITKAMKLVAAAKLRRATDAVVQSRPYARVMRQMLASVSHATDPSTNPLFAAADAPRTCLLVPVTSDRGLCGGFNATILRQTTAFLTDQAAGYERIVVSPLGRKGTGFARRTQLKLGRDLDALRLARHADTAAVLARQLVDDFLNTDVDAVFLVYNQFVSALTQNVVTLQLLPLSASSFDEVEDAPSDFIFEPGQQELLEALLPKYIESQILAALLESEASELGARMTAMDNATKNASDLIERLTLQMNRARQAMITTELMEITSGAEALKG
ncbi:MAG: ATP synthase F1 subunit gamma [Myxococcales bacterium]|nr:ATP synthase F1 subunit gamma [Myxococcales bacterium]MCB9532046.1 ATP synthase F1 subunit gamma [Myxococcales bacterium]